MLEIYLKGKKCQQSSGDSVTGKPATNPAVVALDTITLKGHKGHTVEILSLTMKQ
jgi:hypothetical protein